MSLHVKGVKDDSGKNRVSLVIGGFALAILEVSKVGTFGANKYTDNGWQTVPNGIARYEDALLRHFMAYKDGEFFDPESKLPHLAHCAWNALAVLSLVLKERNNASKSVSQEPKSTGQVDRKSGAILPQVHPRRADDTSNVLKEWPIFAGGAGQQVTHTTASLSALLRKEQARNEQQRNFECAKGSLVQGPMGYVGVRGSSIVSADDQGRIT